MNDIKRISTAPWWDKFLASVEKAWEVELATYMFDDAQLFATLLSRLSDKSQFALSMYLDREMFDRPVL